MLKTSFIAAAAALAVALPVVAQEGSKAKAPGIEPAAKHSATSTSDRQVAKKLAATGSTVTASLGAQRPAPETRDWAAIDTNRDHLISPDEMQKYLEDSWASRKK